MPYSVKETYRTLQGEGAHAGRVAVLCRFAGCNLWTGREADRAGADCDFCDTDFVGTDGPGGGVFHTAAALAEHIRAVWDATSGPEDAYVVFTGGEPMLQLDLPLIEACHDLELEVAVETNGTLAVPPEVDWICVSPKPPGPLVQDTGDELKLVYPQAALPPDRFVGLTFSHFYLQPMDGPARAANTDAAIAFCAAHPRWRLSLQTHKLIGLP